MENVTIQQAFLAMTFYLEEYAQRIHSEDILSLLGDLDTEIGKDDMTGDPAAWYDWMASVQKASLLNEPEQQQLVQNVIKNPENYKGRDLDGNDVYTNILADGRQVWSLVRNGRFLFGGIRQEPREFEPSQRFTSPSRP